jgi:membrane protease YdiL (CAAX protease family)
MGIGIESFGQSRSEAISRPWVRPVVEIAVVYGLLEGALWSPRPAQYWWGLATLFAVVVLTAVGRRSPNRLGIWMRGLRRSWPVIPIAIAASALLLGFGAAVGTIHSLNQSTVPVLRGTAYLIWSLVQEFLAQSFFFVRLERVLPSRRAVIVNAAIFAVAHIPNPVLMPATFVVGLAFTEAFRRYRNIYPIAVAHAMLGLSLAATIPYSWPHHMKVGVAYFLR